MRLPMKVDRPPRPLHSDASAELDEFEIRIEVRSDDELRYWAKKFGIEVKTLTRAVRAAGPSVGAVRQHLLNHPPMAGD